MIKKFRRSLLIILSIAITLNYQRGFTVHAQEGICGSGVTYSLSDGVLSINGSGAMDDYEVGNAPWSDDTDTINSIIISQSITSIGAYAFYGCDALVQNISVPSDVKSLGNNCFGALSSAIKISVNCQQFEESVLLQSGLTLQQVLLIHNWNEGVVVLKPTIESPGIRMFNCRRCSLSRNEEISQLIAFGSAGLSANWKMNNDGVVTITGSSIIAPDSQLSSQKEFVERIIIENGPVEITENAFEGYTNLSSVTLPPSIATIGAGAFKGCLSLSSVNLSDVTGYGDGVFENCVSIQEVSFNSDVQMIPARLFSGCILLSDVTLNEGLIAIGNRAFANTGLSVLSVPASLSSIGDFVFYGCRDLKNITVSPSNTIYGDIDGSALMQLSNNEIVLATKSLIAIPDNVTSIGYGAFAGIQADNGEDSIQITIPTSVNSLCTDCFKDYQGTVYVNCSQFTTAQIALACINTISYIHDWDDGTLTTLPSDTIEGIITYTCRRNSAHTKTETVGLAKACNYNSDTTLFWYIDAQDALHLCANTSATVDSDTALQWESYKESIKTVCVEKGISTIKSGVFTHMPSVQSVEISQNVTTIEDGAFSGLCAVTSISVKTGNTVYNSSCNGIMENSTKRLIYACSDTQLMEGVRIIGSHAYDGLTEMTELSIPENVETIEDDAFVRMSSLQRISVDQNNSFYTGKNADSNCIIDKNTNRLILGCANTIIPDGVTTISQYAFNYAQTLVSMEIPNTVTLIESGAFSYCESLQTIVAQAGNPVYTTLQDNCGIWSVGMTGTMCLIVGCGATDLSDVDFIGDNAFRGNLRIDDVCLSASLVSIGNNAFADCCIDTLSVPISYRCFDSAFDNATIDKVILIQDALSRPAYSYSASDCRSTIWYNREGIVIEIEDGIVSIGSYTFKDIVTEDICLPASVQSLGKNCFEGTDATIHYGCTQFSAQQITDAKIRNSVLIHDYESGFTIDTLPDCAHEGSKSRHCKNCEAKTQTTSIASLGHHMTYMPAKEATCLEGGNIAYYCCDRCQKNYQDEAGVIIINGEVTTQPLGHNPVYFAAKNASCTSKGNIEYWHCLRCDKYYTDAQCTQEITKAQTEIAMSEHDVIHMDYHDATCEQDGNLEYWYCTECGTYYLDEQCMILVLLQDVTIDAYGHDWENDYTIDEFADCENSGSKSLHCKNCSATKDRTVIPAQGHHGQKIEKVDEGCETDGCMEHYECTGCGRLYLDELCTIPTEAEELVIAAHGHNYGEYVSDNNATLDADGTKTHECSTCHDTQSITDVGSRLYLSSIEVDNLPSKRYYKKQTENLDLSGATLLLHFTNGNSSQIIVRDNAKIAISGFDNSEVGEKTIKLVYYEKETCFTVTVQEDKRADFTRDGKVTDRDAVYLLYHVIFPNRPEFQIYQDADMNKDGKVTDRDAVYLLYHVIFPNNPDFSID